MAGYQRHRRAKARSLTPFAVLRVDAGPEIGLGHLARCAALSEALQATGWRCVFATTTDSRKFADASFFPADVALCDGGAASVRAALGRTCDLLVVDGYHLDRGFEQAAREWAPTILAIDDVPSRPHDCDLLLDPTIGRTANEYAGLVPAGCEFLFGPHYVPLRSQFAQARAGALARDRRGSRRLLVSFGGANDELALRVIEGLVPVPDDHDVDVVISRMSTSGALLDSLAQQSGSRVTLHVNPPAVAAMMAASDLAIGAAGVTSWERCTVGLPGLVVVAADNQAQIAARLERAGAVRAISRSALRRDTLLPLIAALDLPTMSNAAAAVCDGEGASRVAVAATHLAGRVGRV